MAVAETRRGIKRKNDDSAQELTRKEIEAALKQSIMQLGYETLERDQENAIIPFVEGNDVFICLPTGFGKSLCYFCLPRVFDILLKKDIGSVALVVSPLVALMTDQVDILKSKGVSAVIATNKGDTESAKNAIVNGKFQMIFTNPETLFDKEWRDIWRSPSLIEDMIAFVVDEAHCVRKWGKEFRKDFSKLGDLRGFFPPSVHFMALTATASKSTRNEVIRILGMKKPVLVVRPPDKTNIVYTVTEKSDDLESTFAPLVEELRSTRQFMERTIVFCRTYQDCSNLYLYIRSTMGKEFTHPIGLPDYPSFRLVDMFTACNTPSLKRAILKSFSIPNGTLRIVIATIAFGMGIDCPDVHRIIHWGPPSDIESYIQETGRAGRDGKTAQAQLLYSKRDISFSFMEDSITSYCKNTTLCRREVLFKDFEYLSQERPVGPLCCDICAITQNNHNL